MLAVGCHESDLLYYEVGLCYAMGGSKFQKLELLFQRVPVQFGRVKLIELSRDPKISTHR